MNKEFIIFLVDSLLETKPGFLVIERNHIRIRYPLNFTKLEKMQITDTKTKKKTQIKPQKESLFIT